MASEIIEKTAAPLRARLDELKPLIDEYQEVQDALERLEGPRGQRRARPAATATAAPTRRRSGGRRTQVLELLGSKPGLTVKEIGGELGIAENYLYRVTGDLVSDGALRKEGTQLFVAEAA